jgi:hypothetical protein
MWKLARSILGIVVGMALAVAVISAANGINHTIYPPPAAAIDAGNRGDMQAAAIAVKEWLPQAPLGALVLVPAGWIAGAFAGSLAAALIAGRGPLIHALIVGLLPLAGAILMLRWIPHPTWIAIAGLSGVPLAALLAGLLTRRLQSTGPRRYDMREKNMAC